MHSVTLGTRSSPLYTRLQNAVNIIIMPVTVWCKVWKWPELVVHKTWNSFLWPNTCSSNWEVWQQHMMETSKPHIREYEFSVHPKFLPKCVVDGFGRPKTIVLNQFASTLKTWTPQYGGSTTALSLCPPKWQYIVMTEGSRSSEGPGVAPWSPLINRSHGTSLVGCRTEMRAFLRDNNIFLKETFVCQP